jgi:hypothetical protein
MFNTSADPWPKKKRLFFFFGGGGGIRKERCIIYYNISVVSNCIHYIETKSLRLSKRISEYYAFIKIIVLCIHIDEIQTCDRITRIMNVVPVHIFCILAASLGSD